MLNLDTHIVVHYLEGSLKPKEFALYHNFLRACSILPITTAIAKVSMQLDFNTEPADHLIAATSIVHGLPLLTRDAKIRKSKLVEFA